MSDPSARAQGHTRLAAAAARWEFYWLAFLPASAGHQAITLSLYPFPTPEMLRLTLGTERILKRVKER